MRNIRAYQDRGILPPPEKRGRVGVYTKAHLGRLRVINTLLDRGYTIANIGELLQMWEGGGDLATLLGLEQAITSPFSDEQPRIYSMPQLVKLFGVNSFNPKVVQKCIQLGILEQTGMRFRAPSPKLLNAGAEMVKIGISLEELLDVVRMLRGNVERVADSLVQLVAEQLDS